MAASVVHTYAELFFDLPAPGNGSDWVLRTVLLDGSDGAVGEVNEGRMWRWLAWSAGTCALDILVADSLGRTEPIMENRHELAETLRFLVRERVQSFQSPVPPPALLAEIERQVAVRLQRDPGTAESESLRLLVDFLRILAGQKPHGPGKAPPETGSVRQAIHESGSETSAQECTPLGASASDSVGV